MFLLYIQRLSLLCALVLHGASGYEFDGSSRVLPLHVTADHDQTSRPTTVKKVTSTQACLSHNDLYSQQMLQALVSLRHPSFVVSYEEVEALPENPERKRYKSALMIIKEKLRKEEDATDAKQHSAKLQQWEKLVQEIKCLGRHPKNSEVMDILNKAPKELDVKDAKRTVEKMQEKRDSYDKNRRSTMMSLRDSPAIKPLLPALQGADLDCAKLEGDAKQKYDALSKNEKEWLKRILARMQSSRTEAKKKHEWEQWLPAAMAYIESQIKEKNPASPTDSLMKKRIDPEEALDSKPEARDPEGAYKVRRGVSLVSVLQQKQKDQVAQNVSAIARISDQLIDDIVEIKQKIKIAGPSQLRSEVGDDLAQQEKPIVKRTAVRDRLEKAMNAGEDVADLWKAEKEKIDRIDARNREIKSAAYVSVPLHDRVKRVIWFLAGSDQVPAEFLQTSCQKVTVDKVEEVLANFQASDLGVAFRKKEESDSLQNMRVGRKRRANH